MRHVRHIEGWANWPTDTQESWIFAMVCKNKLASIKHNKSVTFSTNDNIHFKGVLHVHKYTVRYADIVDDVDYSEYPVCYRCLKKLWPQYSPKDVRACIEIFKQNNCGVDNFNKFLKMTLG